ncbi:MAG: arylamine N-acetyltransferase [Coriobacteriia bacterium]|nr:arylamine N-acetyltransferase [Coriobacteriia bacterium]
MFSHLTAPLADPAAYWKRLGLAPEQAGQDESADVELLDRLVMAHQRTISFECMDSRFQLAPIDLGIRALERKVISGNRGGYCFELNALFRTLLTEAGFDAQPVIARIVRMATGPESPLNHHGILVRIGGQLRYADVGFGGPMAACSLPVEDGSVTQSCGQEFQVTRASTGWWMISYRRAGGDADWVDVCLFRDEPCLPSDFLPLSWYTETHPESVFRTTLLLNRRTADGNVSLRENQFTRRSGDAVEQSTATWAELPQLLEREFLITPPPGLPTA